MLQKSNSMDEITIDANDVLRDNEGKAVGKAIRDSKGDYIGEIIEGNITRFRYPDGTTKIFNGIHGVDKYEAARQTDDILTNVSRGLNKHYKESYAGELDIDSK